MNKVIKKLEEILHKNSTSKVAQETDNHIVLHDSLSSINVPRIYSYINMIDDYSSGSIEQYVLDYINFFENRKFFSVNEEISSIEVYAPNEKIKNYYAERIEEYNKDKEDCYQIKHLDLSKRVIRYFKSYFSIFETTLYDISASALVVSVVLSLSIIFSLVASRVKEIGIYKSSGYSNRYVLSLIEVESLFLGTVSGVVGCVTGSSHCSIN